MNGAIFEEAGDWSSCSVIMPPGRHVDNIWTLLPAGLLKVLWKLGLKGCRRMLGEYEPDRCCENQGVKRGEQVLLLLLPSDEGKLSGQGTLLCSDQKGAGQSAGGWCTSLARGDDRVFMEAVRELRLRDGGEDLAWQRRGSRRRNGEEGRRGCAGLGPDMVAREANAMMICSRKAREVVRYPIGTRRCRCAESMWASVSEYYECMGAQHRRAARVSNLVARERD